MSANKVYPASSFDSAWCRLNQDLMVFFYCLYNFSLQHLLRVPLLDNSIMPNYKSINLHLNFIFYESLFYHLLYSFANRLISSRICSTKYSGPTIFTPSPNAIIQCTKCLLAATFTATLKCSLSTLVIRTSFPKRSIITPARLFSQNFYGLFFSFKHIEHLFHMLPYQVL